MNHAFGLSTIRTWNQAYQIETEFDPDDEMVFLAETAEAADALRSRDLDGVVDVIVRRASRDTVNRIKAARR